MPRFIVIRSGRRVEIAFDDGGVNVLSSEALRELRAIVRGVIPSRRSPGGTEDGEGPSADEREASLGTGSFAALHPFGVPPAQDDTGAAPAQDDTPRLLLFRSSHARIFAAGADMAEMAQFTPFDAAEFARLGQETFRAIERLPMITVALIDGDCFGGALDLVLSFDLRFATPRSRFSHPGGKLGIVTGFGGTSRWRKVIGRSAARALFLGNPLVSAAEAADMGLVDRAAEEFDDELRRLELLDPATAQFVKELTIHGERLSRSERLLVAERLGHIYFDADR